MNKKILVFVILAFLLLACYKFFCSKSANNTTSNQPITLKKHSQEFNQSINEIVNGYLALKDALVNADTILVKSKSQDFIKLLENIDTAELSKDTALVFETIMSTITDLKSNANSIIQQTSITEMRKDFSSLTEVMFPSFFYAIQYEGPTLYLQNCPMAIDDSIPANWISNNAEIVNPYLGNHHPVYQSTMLHCGEIKDSIIAK